MGLKLVGIDVPQAEMEMDGFFKDGNLVADKYESWQAMDLEKYPQPRQYVTNGKVDVKRIVEDRKTLQCFVAETLQRMEKEWSFQTIRDLRSILQTVENPKDCVEKLKQLEYGRVKEEDDISAKQSSSKSSRIHIGGANKLNHDCEACMKLSPTKKFMELTLEVEHNFMKLSVPKHMRKTFKYDKEAKHLYGLGRTTTRLSLT